MNFDRGARVTDQWALWNSQRASQQPARTLCESRIAWLRKSVVRRFSHSRFATEAQRAFSLVNWTAVMIVCWIFAAFVSGLCVAGFALLERVCR